MYLLTYYLRYLFFSRYDPLGLSMANERGVSVANSAGGKKDKVDIYRDTPIRYLGDNLLLLFYTVNTLESGWWLPNSRRILRQWSVFQTGNLVRIIIGSDRRPKTQQGIEGKIVRFRSGRVRNRVRLRDKDRRSAPDRWSEAISFGAC